MMSHHTAETNPEVKAGSITKIALLPVGVRALLERVLNGYWQMVLIPRRATEHRDRRIRKDR